MQDLGNALYDQLIPQIALLIAAIVTSTAAGLWARTQVWARRKLNLELEELNRGAMNAAIETGVTAFMSRDVPIHMKIDMIVDYVSRSTPDALAALKAPAQVLREKIAARLETEIANSRLLGGFGSQPAEVEPR